MAVLLGMAVGGVTERESGADMAQRIGGSCGDGWGGFPDLTVVVM